VRDPHKKLVEQQLNGGVFAPFTNADWRLIRTYLEENERLFGIKVQDLLTVNGKLCEPEQVYRKVSAQALPCWRRQRRRRNDDEFGCGRNLGRLRVAGGS
jgi:hypothetical protein